MGRPVPQPKSMTAALRGSVRAQLRTSRVPTAVDGARPRPARNSAATPSYPLDRSIISGLFQFLEPNGVRYPLVGGTRQCRFDGTNLKPQNLPENAATPTTIVLVLFQGSGARCVRRFLLYHNLVFGSFHGSVPGRRN